MADGTAAGAADCEAEFHGIGTASGTAGSSFVTAQPVAFLLSFSEVAITKRRLRLASRSFRVELGTRATIRSFHHDCESADAGRAYRTPPESSGRHARRLTIK